MKFFAFFAFAAILAIAAAGSYPYEYEAYEDDYEMAESAAQPELARPERSYGGAKCGKAVLVACGPVVKKVKCKGGY